MAKNLSKLFGIPSSKTRGEQQHKELSKKLKKNEVFYLPSQNKGYLVLKKGPQGTYQNILQSTKPTKGTAKVTRIPMRKK